MGEDGPANRARVVCPSPPAESRTTGESSRTLGTGNFCVVEELFNEALRSFGFDRLSHERT